MKNNEYIKLTIELSTNVFQCCLGHKYVFLNYLTNCCIAVLLEKVWHP